MSWYRDPELFIYYWDSSYGYGIGRIRKSYNTPLGGGDITYEEGQLNFSKHLSLGNNSESDYAALKSHLLKNADVVTHENVKYVNCQGLVVNCSYQKSPGTWSRVEELNSIFYSLPGIINPSEKKDLELVAEISLLKEKLKNEVTNLQDQLIQEKNAKQALQTQVLELKAKLEESRGSADVQPWMTGDTVPSHLVPFEDLDVLNFPKTTSVTITEGPSKPSSAYFWTQAEELTSVVKSLQAHMKLAEKLQVVERKNSELVAETSSLRNLLNQVKYDNQALQTRVSDLTTKLEECCGSRGGSTDVQPWMKEDTVPNHWVPLEELDVLNLPKNPVAIMEEPSQPKFVEDLTTNVQVHRFYRGAFIVAVNVEELIPDNEK
ncbi:hypothetical protein MKW94_029166 [Papaver nudicaule]|uniref:Uncharacterized protein n=1 Tax=Papaver nudicaule TaxID=74823 RepID=A0AA41SM06_PAPNU|nr:hypothetical protein [Papaver nudicaule]